MIVYITVTDQEEQDAEKKMALASPSDVMEMVFIETLYFLITSPINYPDFAFLIQLSILDNGVCIVFEGTITIYKIKPKQLQLSPVRTKVVLLNAPMIIERFDFV